MTAPDLSAPEQARLVAMVQLLERTGAESFQLRYSDDELPVVWMAVTVYGGAAKVAAALGPLDAISRLCEDVIDGGTCTHCGRITAYTDASADVFAAGDLCWRWWDADAGVMRRGCES